MVVACQVQLQAACSQLRLPLLTVRTPTVGLHGSSLLDVRVELMHHMHWCASSWRLGWCSGVPGQMSGTCFWLTWLYASW